MAVYATIFNPGPSVVTYDSLGHVVGSQEWATALTTDDVTRELLEMGALVEVNRHADAGLDREAAEVIGRSELWHDRLKSLEDVGKPSLLEAAVAAGLVAEGDDPHRADLERILVESNGPLPQPPEPEPEPEPDPEPEPEPDAPAPAKKAAAKKAAAKKTSGSRS